MIPNAKEIEQRVVDKQIAFEESETLVDLRFCFLIKPEAEMAHDEYGDSAECYTQIKLGNCKKAPETQDDYDAIHKKLAGNLAKQIGLDPEWVVPISEEEYDAEIEGEEEDYEV
ncbi:hypothetical protein [Paenibacillus sp. NAIST15-1]|uniref:hypothetical protein n=1 Tax=Paenibacillus sp. NAIST15-1 TaxID=1605994 RepID=UPI00086CC6F9|nr:hypothetical protein [Paenibacillus sp. NAIST15-1]GAV13250.1 hypothetical protein PBN151_3184 [Paenibacillus sp. NAIST15-1]